MLESVKLLSSVIQMEVDAGIDPARIVLGGFSQGATMSLLTGLTGEWKVAGIVALSGWIPLKDKFKAVSLVASYPLFTDASVQMSSPNANSTPVFWGHGTLDPLVKFKYAQDSIEFLTAQLGIPETLPGGLKGLEFHPYEGVGHATNQKELDDLRTWIKRAIPKPEQ
jgi:predicted esterase